MRMTLLQRLRDLTFLELLDRDKHLTAREHEILERILATGIKFGAQAQIARDLGISQSRISEILHRICTKLRKPNHDPRSIASLELPPRVLNALANHGIVTIDQLCFLRRAQLAALYNLGRKSIDQLVAALAKIGRELRREIIEADFLACRWCGRRPTHFAELARPGDPCTRRFVSSSLEPWNKMQCGGAYDVRDDLYTEWRRWKAAQLDQQQQPCEPTDEVQS